MTPFCVTPLFVPADRPERFAKAAGSGADAVIIDLEDAVAPDVKILARNALRLPDLLPRGIEIFIRVNAYGSEWHAQDIAAIIGLPISGLILPKAESAADIATTAATLPGLAIIALVETARGMAALRDIVQTQKISRLAFGSFDYCLDIGARHTRESLLAARSEIVLASRLGGLAAPIDGVTLDIADAAAVEDDARYASQLGFGGKLCIHPKQMAAAFRGFAPAADEIAWAKRIMATSGAGAVSVDGLMVDKPVRMRAEQILSRVTGAP